MMRKKANVLLALLIVALTVVLVWLVFTEGVSEIHAAAAQGDLAQMRSLLTQEPGLVHARDKDGWTPLHVAADAGHSDMVELLLTNGAEVNAKTSVGSRWGYSKKEFGWTPLHMAANSGDKEMAELLFATGVEVNVKTNVGHTPLHMATIEGHESMVELLLHKGAEVDVKNDAGHTPLTYSTVMGHHGVADLLRKHGAVDRRAPESWDRGLDMIMPPSWVGCNNLCEPAKVSDAVARE